MFVSLSLPRVEGADLRPWVPPEHSLVISSVHDAPQREAGEDAGGGGGNAAGSASLLTLEWEAAAQMAQQKLQVPLCFALAVLLCDSRKKASWRADCGALQSNMSAAAGCCAWPLVLTPVCAR